MRFWSGTILAVLVVGIHELCCWCVFTLTSWRTSYMELRKGFSFSVAIVINKCFAIRRLAMSCSVICGCASGFSISLLHGSIRIWFDVTWAFVLAKTLNLVLVHYATLRLLSTRLSSLSVPSTLWSLWFLLQTLLSHLIWGDGEKIWCDWYPRLWWRYEILRSCNRQFQLLIYACRGDGK